MTDAQKAAVLSVLKKLRDEAHGLRLGTGRMRVFDENYVDGVNDTVVDIITALDAVIAEYEKGEPCDTQS